LSSRPTNRSKLPASFSARPALATDLKDYPAVPSSFLPRRKIRCFAWADPARNLRDSVFRVRDRRRLSANCRHQERGFRLRHAGRCKPAKTSASQLSTRTSTLSSPSERATRSASLARMHSQIPRGAPRAVSGYQLHPNRHQQKGGLAPTHPVATAVRVHYIIFPATGQKHAPPVPV